MTFGDPGKKGNRIGSGVERAETELTAYICSSDVVEFLERLNEYVGDPVWSLVTVDRTNDGEYYAFLIVNQGR